MAGQSSFTPTAADYVAANRANIVWAWRRRRTIRAWIGMTTLMAGVGALLGWSMGDAADALWVSLAYAGLGVLLMPMLYGIAYVLAPYRLGRLSGNNARPP